MEKQTKIIHKDVISLNLETLYHRLPTEYYINPDSYVGVILLCPERDWNGSMNYKVIEDIFFNCVNNKLSVLRFTNQPMGNYDFEEDTKQYVAQISIAIDYFLDISDKKITKLILIGSHLGSYISLHIQLRRPIIDGIIMISPSFLHYQYTDLMIKTNLEQHIIVGENDIIAKKQKDNDISLVELYCKILKVPTENISYIPNGTNDLSEQSKLVTQIAMEKIQYIFDKYIEKDLEEFDDIDINDISLHE